MAVIDHRRAVERAELPRVLGPLQAFSIVVGGVVGASIFLVPSVVARRVPFLGGILLVWVMGAAISLAGVLTVAELSAMLPQAGGGYVYIRAALGPGAAFLFGWTDALLIRAGAAATICFTFSVYFTQLLPPPVAMPLPLWQAAVSVAAIALLAAVNIAGARSGANLQVAGTLLKILALASAMLVPLFLWRGLNGMNSLPFWPAAPLTGGLFAALVPVLWTYGGWEQLAHLAEEVREPSRNLPRVLAAGIFTVAALYLAVVVGIHYVLPYGVVAASSAVGADLFRALLGARGTLLISLVIMVSAFISANGAVMAGPRSCFAVARDGFLPAWVSRIHPRFQTPANAIVVLALWSAFLIVVSAALLVMPVPVGLPATLGSLWMGLRQRPLFDVLISYVMFGYLGFQALVVVSAMVLRSTHPEWVRPFRVPLYPWLPLASLLATLFLMVTIIRTSPFEAVAGTLIVLSGVPVWLLYRRPAQKLRTAESTLGHAGESGSIKSK